MDLIDAGEFNLGTLAGHAATEGFDPNPLSGRQEISERIIARHCKY
jgi:hypothetical protein